MKKKSFHVSSFPGSAPWWWPWNRPWWRGPPSYSSWAFPSLWAQPQPALPAPAHHCCSVGPAGEASAADAAAQPPGSSNSSPWAQEGTAYDCNLVSNTVLRIRDVYPGSWIRIFAKHEDVKSRGADTRYRNLIQKEHGKQFCEFVPGRIQNFRRMRAKNLFGSGSEKLSIRTKF